MQYKIPLVNSGSGAGLNLVDNPFWDQKLKKHIEAGVVIILICWSIMK